MCILDPSCRIHLTQPQITPFAPFASSRFKTKEPPASLKTPSTPRTIREALGYVDPGSPQDPHDPTPKTPFASFASLRFKDKPLAEKTIEDVLLHFGETQTVVRRRYHDFVEKGIAQGRRPEFQGGGLVRSAGGKKAGLLDRSKEEREKGDARILGIGDFVSETLQQAEVKLEKKYLPKRPIEELIQIVAGKLGVTPESIYSGNKQRRYAEARSLVAFLAVEEVGLPAAEVARFLGITRMGVQKAVMRCLELLNRNPLFEN